MDIQVIDKPKAGTLKEWIAGQRGRLEEALPEGSVSINRFISAATSEIIANPKLQQCDKASLAESLILSARFGLEVGPALGQAFLIPYNDRRQNADGQWGKVMTCHFQVGYKGLIVLARRSKTIKTIVAEVVREKDTFEVELGTQPKLTHKVNYLEDRGAPIAYYAAVTLENGGIQFKVISSHEAAQHRDKYSKAAGQGDSPWQTNFDDMALKTAIIKVLKLCPMSVEAHEAVNREERQDEMRNVTPSYTDLPPPSDDALFIPEPKAEDPKAKDWKAAILAAAGTKKISKADLY